MTEHTQGTLDGFALAQEGAQRAMDTPTARSRALAATRRAASWPSSSSNTRRSRSEDVWIAAEKAGVPKPPDRRAWGGIINGFGAAGTR
jgi:hypothetical protein